MMPSKNPYETMQRTASQSAFHFSSLCHPPFGCVAGFTGLSVPNLVCNKCETIALKGGSTMRVARPTDNLAAIADMYVTGLGFAMLAQFEDHRGFDGVVPGHPKQPYHIEFTSLRGHKVGNAPTPDHLLVFYVADKDEWEADCAQLISAGFREVPSYNPYWDLHGRTFEDVDGYRVVLQNARWTK